MISSDLRDGQTSELQDLLAEALRGAGNVVLALTAKRQFSLNGLKPTRMGRQLGRDATVIKEHVDA